MTWNRGDLYGIITKIHYFKEKRLMQNNIVRNKNNFRRDMAIEKKLLAYIKYADTSERNKEITLLYLNGKPYKELAEKYGVTNNRIAGIVARTLNRTYWYKKRNNIAD